MAHIRKQIRDAVKARLTGLPTTGPRVFPSLVYPLEDKELPAIRIYTIRDIPTVVAQGKPRKMQRGVQVVVEGVVKVNQSIEDELDEIGVEVEAALSGQELRGLVKELTLEEATESLTMEGERQAGLLRMVFLAVLYIAENDPQTPLL